MAEPQNTPLRLVDPGTGIFGDFDECPTCAEWQRKYNGLLSQLALLRADKEKEARQHDLWPQALRLFEWWKFATGHKKSRWTADRFWTVERFLREEGYADCVKALQGLFRSEWHMKRGKYQDREGSVFDEFERVFGTQAEFEKWRDSIPPPSQETVDFFEWFDRLPG